MNKTLELFIGSNNHTHKVEMDKLEATLAKYHEAFTIKRGVIGYWQGTREESVTVIISDNFEAIIDTIKRLKQVLKQDAIAYHEVTPLEFI
jgi:hypothetical protein